MQAFCPECNATETLTPDRWRCDCGAAWEPVERIDFDPDRDIDLSDTSVWRYRRLLGLDFETTMLRLGTGWTPLLPLTSDSRVLFKLEYIAPTASFKDRGTAVMINILAHQGVTRVTTDSSGNAGASMAAFAARAGMQADIFVPAYASLDKQAQIAVYGAEVHPIPGVRANAKHAAQKAALNGATLASHAYHPGFLAGQQALAWELWEQLGRRAPDWYIVPVGQGTHLLGVWLGFRRLRAAGLVERMPRLVAVQPTLMSPVYHALKAGLETVSPVEATTPSIAEGLAIAAPVRGRRILQAIRETDGTCITVQDEATSQAQRQLARHGLYVEPTSATVVAALKLVLRQAAPDATIVVPLTGSGLKGSPCV